jgi:hypothetical protein
VSLYFLLKLKQLTVVRSALVFINGYSQSSQRLWREQDGTVDGFCCKVLLLVQLPWLLLKVHLPRVLAGLLSGSAGLRGRCPLTKWVGKILVFKAPMRPSFNGLNGKT